MVLDTTRGIGLEGVFSKCIEYFSSGITSIDETVGGHLEGSLAVGKFVTASERQFHCVCGGCNVARCHLHHELTAAGDHARVRFR